MSGITLSWQRFDGMISRGIMGSCSHGVAESWGYLGLSIKYVAIGAFIVLLEICDYFGIYGPNTLLGNIFEYQLPRIKTK